jgi:hypothetical protein
VLDRRVLGPLVGLVGLLVPATLAVLAGVVVADRLEGPLEAVLDPLTATAEGLPLVLA